MFFLVLFSAADPVYHQGCTTNVLIKTDQMSPNSMWMCCLPTQFLWLPANLIIRPWLPSSNKPLVKTNQMSQNSMGFYRMTTEYLWPHCDPSSDQLHDIIFCHSKRLLDNIATK